MTQQRDPIVWMVQQSWASTADVTSAQKYGRIEYILGVNDRPGQWPEQCLKKIYAALEQYREGDYFATTLADPAGPMLLGIALAEFGFDEIKWLRWERPPPDSSGERRAGAGTYVPGDIPVSQIVDIVGVG